MIDFSHANSSKQFKKQLEVCDDVCHQLSEGSTHIFGVMVESNIVEGRQDIIDGKNHWFTDKALLMLVLVGKTPKKCCMISQQQ